MYGWQSIYELKLEGDFFFFQLPIVIGEEFKQSGAG